MGRRWIPGCALLIGCAVLWTLCLDGADGPYAASTSTAQADVEVERAMLAGETPHAVSETPETKTAGLVGRTKRVRSGPVRVLVVSDSGRPVPHVEVFIRPEVRAEFTDDEGVARFDVDLPWDGSLDAVVETDELVWTAIRGPQVRLVAEGLRPMTVHVVDAETGETVEPSKFAPHADPVAEITRPGVGQYRYLVLAQKHASGQLNIEPKSGWIAWDQVAWNLPRSAYAEELEVIAPLRREVPVRVTVLDHKGNISNDADIVGFEIAGRSGRLQTERDAYGTRHVHGVPYFRGERLTVTAEIANTTANESASVVLGPDPNRAVELQIRLPKPLPLPANNGFIGIGGGSVGLGFG